MTGRGGKNYLHSPSTNPTVTISLSISFSPAQYNPSSTLPLYITLKSKIVTTPEPIRPITLATWNNPFASLSNCSFTNITCKSNPEKQIQIWPIYHWSKYGPRGLNVREFWDFVTFMPGEDFVLRHEVPQDKLSAVDMEKGEKYHVEVTDLGLGTSWWMFGAMEDVESRKFMRWSDRGVEGLKKYQEENVETLGEPPDDQVWENSEEWVMGEDPQGLRIVVMGEGAEFEIV